MLPSVNLNSLGLIKHCLCFMSHLNIAPCGLYCSLKVMLGRPPSKFSFHLTMTESAYTFTGDTRDGVSGLCFLENVKTFQPPSIDNIIPPEELHPVHCAGPQAVGGPAEELPVVTLLDAAQPQPGHKHRVRHLRVLLGNNM